MADAPTFIHIDKAVTIWLGGDGVACIVYPNKVGTALTTSFTDITGDSYTGDTTHSVTTVVGDNILYYIRSHNQSLNVDGAESVIAVPCIFLDSMGTASVITNAKYPRVTCSPKGNTVYMTYWSNEKDGNTGEPVQSDGTLENGWQRVLYSTVGTPKYMECVPNVVGAPNTKVKDMFYVFSEPVKILTPDKWDSGGGEEPVLDVTMGGTSYWLADPT